MTKYWYCLYDPGYRGNYNIRSTTSFKAACAGLRKMVSESSTEDGGCIYDSDPGKLAPRFQYGQIAPSLVGVIQKEGYKSKDYILYKRKPRTVVRYWPEYIVHYDGSLTARKK